MKETKPPAWAERFLRWYCDPYFLEEIEGDVYELFDRRVADKGHKVARLKFVWDVFRFFRWSNIRKSNSKLLNMNNTILFTSYLKLGLRNIRKNLPSASINILGLALAIGFAITIFIFVDMQYAIDQFHTKGNRIFMLTNYVEQEGEQDLWGDSPIVLGPALAADHPSVEMYARMEYGHASIRNGDYVFDETIIFVDPEFMQMFDFGIAQGNRNSLEQSNQIIISEQVATKYFEYDDPVGKDLSFKFANGQIKRLTVGAVMEGV